MHQSVEKGEFPSQRFLLRGQFCNISNLVIFTSESYVLDESILPTFNQINPPTSWFGAYFYEMEIEIEIEIEIDMMEESSSRSFPITIYIVRRHNQSPSSICIIFFQSLKIVTFNQLACSSFLFNLINPRPNLITKTKEKKQTLHIFLSC